MYLRAGEKLLIMSFWLIEMSEEIFGKGRVLNVTFTDLKKGQDKIDGPAFFCRWGHCRFM